jgi:iron(III) transport system ATP-binding protein
MTSVHVRDLVVGYGGPPIVRAATCSVDSGGFLAIVGASGSGKTTLLRAIAGFLPVTSGTITLGDRLVDGSGVCLPPERRGIGIVTQDGSLFPHLTVARNVGFGLPRRTSADGTPTRERVAEMLDMVGLADMAERSPHELSGGQQQRVALARALAPRPDVVLLDEPFSALDAGLRTELAAEVRELLTVARTTAILVTHDQGEALSLADQIGLMIEGRIVQQGTPEELYQRPGDLGVAAFLGEVVLLPVIDHGPDFVTTALGRVALDGASGASGAAADRLALRPEQFTVAAAGEGAQVSGEVTHVTYHGHDSMVDVRLVDGTPVRIRVLGTGGVHPGDAVSVGVRGLGRLL